MNTRNYQQKGISFGLIVMMILFFGTVIVSGIVYAVLKNQQVDVARSIQREQDKVCECKADTEMLQIKIDQQLNPFMIKQRLASAGSQLRSIDLEKVRKIRPLKSVDPDNSKVASTQ